MSHRRPHPAAFPLSSTSAFAMITAITAITAITGLGSAAHAATVPVELISRAATVSDTAIGELPGAGFDLRPSVSADGRFVAYSSTSAALSAGQLDANAAADVFLWDRTLGTSTLVSHAAVSAVTAATGASGDPAVSADGAFVAYLSGAPDLVAGISDGNAGADLYVWDRAAGSSVLASHAASSASAAANAPALEAAISGDGRYVAFASAATDLSTGQVDSNGDTDVFLWDRITGTVTLVSHVAGMAAKAGAGPSFGPAVSADGRYVAFISFAPDLVAGQVESMGQADVFVWDRTTDTSILVSHAASGTTTAGNGGAIRGVALSSDGGAVAFLSTATNLIAGGTDANGAADAFVWDRATGNVALASHAVGAPSQAGNGAASEVAISGDGTVVAFAGTGTDHVPGQVDPDSTSPDVFAYVRATGALALASRKASAATDASTGAHAPALSADGRFVAFASADPALIGGQVDSGAGEDVFVYDRTGDTTALASHAATQGNRAGLPQLGERALAISADGGAVVYSSPAADLVTGLADANGGNDLFRYDTLGGTNQAITRRAADRPSASAGGLSYVLGQPIAALDAAGRYVAFSSTGVGLVAGQTGFGGTTQVYVRDRNPATLSTSIASHALASPLAPGNNLADAGVASADGRYVAFWSAATDLVAPPLPPGTVGLYLEDRAAATLLRIATSLASKALFDDPSPHAISADGRFVAFVSGATDLVPGQVDGNAGPDVFLFDRTTGTTVLASHSNASTTTAADGPSGHVSLDASGRFLAFESLGSNVAPGQFDNLGLPDVFLYDAQTGNADLVSRSFDTPNSTAVGTSHAPEISADGRWVAFRSDAFDVVLSQTEGNAGDDVFLYDHALLSNRLVSRQAGSASTTGNAPCTEARPSADGRYVAYVCRASDLVAGQSDANGAADLFLYDRIADSSTLASHAVGAPLTALGVDAGSPPSIAADGRFVAFTSAAPLAAGAPARTNVFLFDRFHATNALLSPAAFPASGPVGTSLNPQISADGSVVVFASNSTDLVADDRNGALDVFAAKNPNLGQYFTVSPCRLYDSRGDGAGPLASGAPRIRPAQGLCGVPPTATTIAANVTVTSPTALGFLTLYPGDGAAPGVATLNFAAGQTRTNNAVVRLSADGNGTYAASAFVLGSGTVHVIVDVGGYFE